MSDITPASPPTVSLALPVYNGERYVADAIRSILDQDYQDFELIICDNASTDGTERICRDFAGSDLRVRYVRNERNLGAGPNYNLGFELSRGKYFKWSACDDRISKNFLSGCVEALERNPDAILSYGRTQSIDQDGHVIPLVGAMMNPQQPGDGPLQRFKDHLGSSLTNFEIFGLFRSTALRESTLHRSYYGSDKTLMAELTLLGRFVFVPGIVFYNREHADRSINIWDKKVLASWMDTKATTKHTLPNFQRLRHLLEIAVRHNRVVSPIKTAGIVLLWALRPVQFGRYVGELIGLVSPTAQLWLLRTARRLVKLTERGSSERPAS